MKTQQLSKFIKSALLTVLASASIFGCSKNSSDNTPVTPIYTYSNGICYSNNGQQVASTLCTNNGYQLIGGNCIQTSTNQVVTPSLCTQGVNSQYQYVNGQCISLVNGQAVTPTLCQNTGVGVAQACYGWYQNASGQQGYCNGPGSGCGGMTLTELSTGRQVICQ